MKTNPPKPHGWFGNYSSWQDALKETSGYDEISILNKIKESILKVKNGEAEYERDSVAFREFEYSKDLLKALKYLVDSNNLTLIDFGGSLGSQYFQYKRFFTNFNITWMIVEQSHFVNCGNKDIANQELFFFNTIELALQHKKANAILLSSVLPYIERPYELIQYIKSFKFDYIIIDRNPFIKMERDLLTIQIVPEYIYNASYPAWFFNEAHFLNAFTDMYDIEQELSSPFAAPMFVNQKQAFWKGFILKKKR